MIKKFINIVFIMLWCNSLYAMDFQIEEHSDNVDLYNYLGVIEDIEGHILVEDLIQNKHQFINNSNNKRDLDDTDSFYWIKLSIQNKSEKALEGYIHALSVEASHFKVYKYEKGKLTFEKDHGYSVYNHPNENIYIHPYFKVALQPHSNVTYYINAKYLRDVAFDMSFSRIGTYSKMLLLDWGFQGLYIGFILCLIIYNLILWVKLRDLDYISYILFTITMGLNVFSLNGGLDVIFENKYYYWIELSDTLLIFTGTFAISFSSNFLKISQFAYKVQLFSKMVIGLGIISGICSLIFSHELFTLISDIYIVIVLINLILVAYVAIQNNVDQAKIFAVSWGVFSVSLVIWKLGKFDLISDSYYTINAPLLGNMAEMILMSTALANRIKSLREEKIAVSFLAKQGEEKKKLLQVVSHDVSNPLAVAKGFLKLLEKSPDSIKRGKYLQKISFSLNMIEEILDSVRKIESSDIFEKNLQMEKVSLSSIFEELDFIFAKKLYDKKVTLKIKNDTSQKLSGIFVLGNKTILVQDIFANLVSNAIKFSYQNSEIIISFSCDESNIYFHIKDHGVGVPEYLINILFNSTATKSRTGTSGEPGTGFGLPIVKNYVDRFDGDIKVFSSTDTQNSWTQFDLTLKRAA